MSNADAKEQSINFIKKTYGLMQSGRYDLFSTEVTDNFLKINPEFQENVDLRPFKELGWLNGYPGMVILNHERLAQIADKYQKVAPPLITAFNPRASGLFMVGQLGILDASGFVSLQGGPVFCSGDYTVEKNTKNLSLKGLPGTIGGTFYVEHLDDLGLDNWRILLSIKVREIQSQGSELAPILTRFLRSGDYLAFVQACSENPRFAGLGATTCPAPVLDLAGLSQLE